MTRTSTKILLGLLLTCGAAAGCTSEAPQDETTGSTESPLKNTEHQLTTSYLCNDVGLAPAFCDRLGAEAFNVDYWEWSLLEAHAMPTLNQSQCDAAAAVQNRLRRLGAEIRVLLAKHALTAGDIDSLAGALGRALHTIQDNCAHEGMNNPQHSWYSNRGYCLSDGEDPDEQESAIQCARGETWAVLNSFLGALNAAGWHQSIPSIQGTGALGTANPTRDQLCPFLHEWAQFDGRDHRWNNAVTIPAFRSTFVNAFSGGADVANVCDGLTAAAGHSPIAIRTPRAGVAVSDPMCFTENVYCVGE